MRFTPHQTLASGGSVVHHFFVAKGSLFLWRVRVPFAKILSFSHCHIIKACKIGYVFSSSLTANFSQGALTFSGPTNYSVQNRLCLSSSLTANFSQGAVTFSGPTNYSVQNRLCLFFLVNCKFFSRNPYFFRVD